MLAAPFGIAAAAKAQSRTVPLWALMLGAQILDVLYLILNLAGVEGAKVAGTIAVPGNATWTLNAPYSHALVTALVLAVLGGLLARGLWGRGAGWALGGVILADWVISFLFCQALPIVPGNAAGMPSIGIGMAYNPTVSAIIQAILVLVGAFLYFRAAMRLPAPSIRSSQAYRTRALTAGLVTAALLILALVVSLIGID